MSILALLLVVAPFPQDAAATRRSHDPDALLFVEVPDLPGLLAAYEQAPLLRMVADEDVRSTVGGLLETGGIDVGAAVAKALEQLGVPAEIARAPLQAGRGMLDQLEAVSFSLALAGEPERVGEDLRNTILTLVELQELRKKVEVHTEEHEGFPPASLDEVDLPDELRRDAWGHPYGIQVDIETLRYELGSPGADGSEGGLGFDADLRAGARHEDEAERLLGRVVHLVVEVDFRETEPMHAAATQLVELVGRAGWTADAPGAPPMGAPDARVRVLQDPDRRERSAWLLEDGRSLVLGYGEGSLEQVVERRRAETASPAPGSQVATLAGHLSEVGGATVVRGWTQLGPLKRILAEAESTIESTWGADMRLPPLSSGNVFRIQLDGDRFVTEIASSAPEGVGATGAEQILDCLSCGPVPERLWSLVPPDAIGVFATSIDAPRLYREILASLGAADAGKPRVLAELEQRHGFNLEQDLFGSLGGGVATYLLPIKGIIPAVAVVAELRDTERFQKGLDGLLRLLEEQAQGEFQVRHRPYRDQPLWWFSFGGDGAAATPFAGPFTPTPSLAIIDDHLLITLTTSRAKKEIKRLLTEEAGVHPVRALSKRPPEDATAVGYMDWPALVDGVYESARSLAMLAGMSNEMPFDPGELPDAATFTRFFRPTVLWSRRAEDGTRLLRLESSFGPETWLGLLGGGAALGLGVRESASHAATVHELETLEVDQDADRAAVIAETKATLGELATRLEVFRIESGHYPRTLDTLLEPTSSYPRGYLPEGTVPVDGWGRDFVYLCASDGTSFTLWSVGENGSDERGGGDDLPLP